MVILPWIDFQFFAVVLQGQGIGMLWLWVGSGEAVRDIDRRYVSIHK